MEKNEANLELESKKRLLENYNKEYGLMKTQLDSLPRTKMMLERERELTQRTHELSMKDFKLLDAHWEFEKNPDYIQVIKEIKQLQFEQSMIMFDNKFEQIMMNTESVNKQLEQITEKIAETEKRIKELEKVE